MHLQENQEPTSIMESLVEYFNKHVFTTHNATLERFQTTLPAICIQSRKQITRGNTNILGEYCASMEFGVVIRISKEQQPSEAYRRIEDVLTFLEDANRTHTYPVLRNGLQCCLIEQRTNVEQQQTQGEAYEDYTILCNLVYKKTNTFN